MSLREEATPTPEPWHALLAREAVSLLGTDGDVGLTEVEVNDRRVRYGANELPAAGRRARWRVLVDQFQSPLVYVLLGAAVATFAIGHPTDTAVILGVVIVNAAVGFIQEWRAGQALAALSAMTVGPATVLRGGRVVRVRGE